MRPDRARRRPFRCRSRPDSPGQCKHSRRLSAADRACRRGVAERRVISGPAARIDGAGDPGSSGEAAPVRDAPPDLTSTAAPVAEDDRAFLEALSPVLSGWGVALDSRQLSLLLSHYHAVVETNRVMNLTRIVSPADAAVMHVADALSVVAWAATEPCVPAAANVLDVGTGAGFPAIPVAIARPAWRVTAIDGTGKKVAFVGRTAASLGLPNLRVLHARAEHAASTGEYDLVLARAVAKLDPLLTWLAPWARVGGFIVAYKNAELTPDEADAGAALASRLALAETEGYSYNLPDESGPAMRQLRIYVRGSGAGQGAPDAPPRQPRRRTNTRTQKHKERKRGRR
ncbi:MAG: 16S rRNA (guanine(527)-N(7))-methyltransferase RsmG [Planctomycetes bacterium]|nr:16S rRNA (guanine(527)-N(7))-methyltransferase RsmG [Planctomycetota bacterium]